jgi:hypothetical protein
LSRTRAVLAVLAGAAALAAVLVPTSGAGAADGCVAWGTLPARVVLGPNGVTVHTTLHATAACRGATMDNGATATLRGPDSRSDVNLRWSRIGGGDQSTYYPSLDRPGTYRIVDGDLQTYDAKYVHIPATWRATTTVLKFEGRFAGVSRRGTSLAATLQFYGRLGWQHHSNVAVSLQRYAGSGQWRTVARTRSASGGRVSFTGVGRGSYRLVSASTGVVWGTARRLGANPT